MPKLVRYTDLYRLLGELSRWGRRFPKRQNRRKAVTQSYEANAVRRTAMPVEPPKEGPWMASSHRSFRPLLAVLGTILIAPACDDVTLSADPGIPGPSVNPVAGASFFVDPSSPAARQAELWRSTRPADAALMDRIAAQPQAAWFGEWSGDVRAAVSSLVDAAARGGDTPVLVAYNIPRRDCGGLSGGGGASPEAYRGWIEAFAEGIGRRSALVILEPDALAMLDCLSSADRETRLELLRHAVSVLRARSTAVVYVDAGHARWHGAEEMAARLRRAGVGDAAGFSLNVSNYVSTEENAAYAGELSRRLGGRGAVIDTGRNGLGATPDQEWCNAPGRALGAPPTTLTGTGSVHALLWIKRPGESDGACNGGPAAGAWWPEYALGLARRAG
jgi:endoglucanase